VYPREFFESVDPDDNDDTCFVAMPFSTKFLKVYDNYIKPAVEAVGLTPVRVDKNFSSSSPILSNILNGITRSTLVIADLTDGNSNVFYEVGLAHSVKRDSQVVLLAQDINLIPFDLRQIRCYPYEIKNNRFSPYKAHFAKFLSDVLEEDQLSQSKARAKLLRTLNPLARTQIEKDRNHRYLRFDRAIFNPHGERDIDVALPAWLCLANLLEHNLVEYKYDDATDEEGYTWTSKAQRIFGFDKNILEP
jgi:hypothetical protein